LNFQIQITKTLSQTISGQHKANSPFLHSPQV